MQAHFFHEVYLVVANYSACVCNSVIYRVN